MRLSNFPEYADDPTLGRPPDILWGTTAPDGDADSPVEWKSARLGTLYVRSVASNTKLYQKQANVPEDADWIELGAATGATSVSASIPINLSNVWVTSGNNSYARVTSGVEKKTIPIPLGSLREVSSNNFINAAGNGGLLATDTTPIIEFTNGDTDSAVRLRWAAANVDAVALQVPIPLDYDEATAITLRAVAAMGGAADTPVIDIDTFFDVGDTKVEDATGAITGTTVAAYTATIAAADIPAGAKTVSIELTPAAHGTDTLLLYSLELEYNVAQTGVYYGTVNGDTDSNRVLTWPAGNATPVVFDTYLPADLDDGEDVTVTIWGKMASNNDTPVISLDSYFDEGDTKVEDDSSAFGDAYAAEVATIGAADVPTTPHKLTIELTPGAHATDALYVSAIFIGYTRL